jgi:hypothetical protein
MTTYRIDFDEQPFGPFADAAKEFHEVNMALLMAGKAQDKNFVSGYLYANYKPAVIEFYKCRIVPTRDAGRPSLRVVAGGAV